MHGKSSAAGSQQESAAGQGDVQRDFTTLGGEWKSRWGTYSQHLSCLYSQKDAPGGLMSAKRGRGSGGNATEEAGDLA